MSSDSIFDGLVINLLSILCILIEILSRAPAKGQKSHNDFRFGIPFGRFPRDDSERLAAKGLILRLCLLNCRLICLY